MLLSSQKRKEIVYDHSSSEYLIEKQNAQHLYNFNLEDEVRFDINIDVYETGFGVEENQHLCEW